MLRDGPPRRSQWPRRGCKAPTRQVNRLSTGSAAPALLMVALARPVDSCDWTCEPWVAFDGELTAVTAAAAGAPVGWRLNGDTVVRRSFTSCNDQTLTITTRTAGSSSACRTSSNDGPDAVVHFGRLATALGGGGGVALGSRPRWRTLAAPPPSRGSGAVHTLRVYAFACPGGAHSQGGRCADTCGGPCSVPHWCHTGATHARATRTAYRPPARRTRQKRRAAQGQLAPARAPPYARCAHRVPVCGQGGPKPPKLPIAMQAPMQALNHRRGERDGRRQPLLREERGGDGGGRSAHGEADRHRALPQRGGLVPCSGQHSSGLALLISRDGSVHNSCRLTGVRCKYDMLKGTKSLPMRRHVPGRSP